MSNFYSSASDREKIYNKHQDTIDMQIIKRSLVCGLHTKLYIPKMVIQIKQKKK